MINAWNFNFIVTNVFYFPDERLSEREMKLSKHIKNSKLNLKTNKTMQPRSQCIMLK